jgi:uncharacterized protein YegJ (DUF2314 family)
VIWFAVAILALVAVLLARHLRRPNQPDPVSIVFLLESPRLLSRQHVLTALEGAGVGEAATDLAEEHTGYFRVMAEGFELTIAGAPIPYAKEHLRAIRLVKIREAVERHQGSLLIDVWKAPAGRERIEAMPLMGRIAAELADETTLAVYQWPTQRINLVTPELLERFRHGEVERAMQANVHDELVSVEQNNERLAEAVKQARDQWPSFVDAWKVAPNKDEFFAKFPFGDEFREYMWVMPIRISDTQVEGVLSSDPHRIRGLKAGDTVTRDLSELNDWLYLTEDKEQVGGFTVKVLENL